MTAVGALTASIVAPWATDAKEVFVLSWFSAAVLFFGCLVAASVSVHKCRDPFPPILSLVDERQEKVTSPSPYYARLMNASRLLSAAEKPPRNGRRVIRDDSADERLIKEQCTAKFSTYDGLYVPAYRTVSPNWPLEVPFLLSRENEEPPDASWNLETGESVWYEPVASDPSQDVRTFLWENTGEPVCTNLVWTKDKDGDLCDIDIDEGDCQGGWTTGELESWICTEYQICVDDGMERLDKLEERRKSLSKLGAAQIGTTSSFAWVLPEGWRKVEEIKEYYREATADQVSEFIAVDLLCLYTFNTCFLSIGVGGWVMSTVGAFMVFLG
jgi:hypothetical protein